LSAKHPSIALIGAPTDVGAGLRGASMGPEALDEGNRTAELCVELVESLFGEEILARASAPSRCSL
jgi:arginase family enzyme